MLTRSVYVRRLLPVDSEEYEKNPSAYLGQWKTDEEGELGEIVSENFIKIPSAVIIFSLTPSKVLL